MDFTYHKEGRRYVIDGDTRCAPKGALGKYGQGLNFDRDLKIWWTGKEELAKKAIEFLQGCKSNRETTLARKATYTKRGDSWCVRVPLGLLDPAKEVPGQTVAVTKASGEAKTETLGNVQERVERSHVVCAVVRKSRGGRSARRRGTWTGCSCGSVEEYSKSTDCWTCRHDAE